MRKAAKSRASRFVIAIAAIAWAGAAAAHGGEVHTGPHGGEVVNLGDVHAEVVFGPEELSVWFLDEKLVILPPPAGASATLIVGKELKKAPLTAQGDRLVAKLATPAAGKALAMIQATVGGSARTVRVKRPDVPAGGLPYHDHRAVHGGLVMMSGDDHAELVAEPGGVYKLWFSDAWRKPHTTGVKGTLTIQADGGVTDTVVLQGPGPDGGLSGKGQALDGVKKTVVLDGFAGKYPFKTAWVFEPVREVKKDAVVEIEVTEAGFLPANLQVKRGQPVRLRITRKTESTCARDLVVPGHLAKVELPLGKPVDVTFTPKKSGQLRYGCSMGQMIGGVIVVE